MWILLLPVAAVLGWWHAKTDRLSKHPVRAALELAVLFLAAVALSGCASTPRVGQHARPSAKLVLSKKLGFAPQSITVRILVMDPAHEMSCPRFFWDCGNGQPPSTVESDCDPDAVADTYGEQRVCHYGEPGDYEVRGFVTDQTHGPGRVNRELVAREPIRLADQEPLVEGAIVGFKR